MQTNLKKGDLVQVIRGNERSSKARGVVLEFLPATNRVRVEGVRVVKRHVRKVEQDGQEAGGILDFPGSVAIANVMLVCPKCTQPTRVGHKVDGAGKKQRVCKKCSAFVDAK